MDIQFQRTPSKGKKKNVQFDEFSTPPKKTLPQETPTPVKSRVRFETPEKSSNDKLSPFKKGENPQSKKHSTKSRAQSPVNWLSSGKKISHFELSRLQADYQFIKFLGSGNFSNVGLYRSRMTDQLFAIKIAELSLMSVNQVQALGTISIFSEKTNHIIKYYHSWTETNNLHIVMEYCDSSLSEKYKIFKTQQESIPEKSIKAILKQSLEGLQCMHMHGMVHLDIKPDNLLLKDDSIKISDLGLCRVTRIKRWSELDEGDSRYLAKQVLNFHEGIDLTKADIFSLGMSILQGCILQELPNNGQNWLSIRQNGLQMRNISAMQKYSRELQQLIQWMIQPNWYNRPSCQQILQHKYFIQQKQQQSKRLSRFLRQNNNMNNSRKKQASL